MQKLFHENQTVLQLIDLAVTNFHVQNFDKGLRLGNEILRRFGELVKDYVEQSEELNNTGMIVIDVQQINGMLMDILNAQQDTDYVLLSDLYQLQLAPYIETVQQAIFEFVSINS